MQPMGQIKQPIVRLLDRAFAGDDTRRQAQRLGYQRVVPAKSKGVRPGNTMAFCTGGTMTENGYCGV